VILITTFLIARRQAPEFLGHHLYSPFPPTPHASPFHVSSPSPCPSRVGSYYINKTLGYRGVSWRSHYTVRGIHSCRTYKVLSLLSWFVLASLPFAHIVCNRHVSLSARDYHASLRAYRAASCATCTLRPYSDTINE